MRSKAPQVAIERTPQQLVVRITHPPLYAPRRVIWLTTAMAVVPAIAGIAALWYRDWNQALISLGFAAWFILLPRLFFAYFAQRVPAVQEERLEMDKDGIRIGHNFRGPITVRQLALDEIFEFQTPPVEMETSSHHAAFETWARVVVKTRSRELRVGWAVTMADAEQIVAALGAELKRLRS